MFKRMLKCETTDKAKRNFWWKHNEDKRKLHFVNWNYLCAPKFASGLGLSSFKHFNQALLARQAWRILMTSDSWMWKSILHGRDLLIKGLDWCIGNGNQLLIINGDICHEELLPFVPI
ncbi:reverse transcriptase [Gossypium australe]|uniref:Reverse transcriptase n=1 Tax=Gossypium australe TaxID=47621 RepID=A0A5B6UDD3_9ROSI|nr:reverse transcriptase [Gossypium australe]